MYVVCKKGIPGILEENQVYSVKKITSKGNYILYEVEAPPPYTSFYKHRFDEIDLEEIDINFEELLNEIEA